MPKKKPAGCLIIERRHEVTVLRMGNPFDAFSMIALSTLVLLTICRVSHLRTDQ